jgi:hypothetical protein
MTTFNGDTLLQLLPSLYRLRDAERAQVLERLLDVLAHPAQVLQEDLAQLYDDQFIETCADWAVPYIGDLIGYRQLNGVTAAISSPRAEVTNTIHLRRGKGTVTVLEGLARDVTGWDASATEYLLLLAMSQHMKHVRPGAGGTIDLRQDQVLERIGTAFDSAARSADVRGIDGCGGRYNLPNLGIHLWRQASTGLTRANAFRVDATRWFFNPLGADMPLLRDPQPMPGDAPRATEANLPLPITRRGLNADLLAFYGVDASFFIEGLAAGTVMMAANLSDLDAAGTQWAHVPPAGAVLVDPELGRIVFAQEPAAPVVVRFHHGSVAPLGGGEYGRQDTMNLALAPVVQAAQSAGGLQAALDQVKAGGAVEVAESLTRVETPAIALAANAVVEWRAADQSRPVVQLAGTLQISSANGSDLTLNGLVITGGALHVAAAAGGGTLRRLRLVHCTLVPGIALAADGSAKQAGAPSLIVETTGTAVELDHCIVGALRIDALASVSLTSCIVDAGDPSAVAFAALDGAGPGAPLQADQSTLIGRVHTAALSSASDCILHARAAATAEVPPWAAPVWSERRQEGYVRFSYLPLEALVPRRFRCQPAASADQSRVVPMFNSLRYGDAAYGQLSRRSAAEILSGADDGSEMGVHHELMAQQRESNLRLRLAEYLRVGLDSGLLFET